MDAIFDFGWMSILLILAQFFRSRSRWLRACHIPTAMLAGLLALVGGPQGLDWIGFRVVDGQPALAGYPALLVVILFATMFLGGAEQTSPVSSGALRSAADTLFVGLGVMLGQYGLALTIGAAGLRWFAADFPPEFALLMPASFAGGPGTAAAVATTMENHDFAEALPVGMVLASIGLVAGNVGGMLLINLAVRLGWTRLVHRVPAAASEQIAEDSGRVPVRRTSADNLTWHIAVLLATVVVARILQTQINGRLPFDADLPLFVCAMPAALLVRALLGTVRIGSALDGELIGQIGSLATDFLVAFGIAGVKLASVRQHALPISLLAALGLAYTIGSLWIAGRRLYRNYWFERSIFAYGWNMGVVSTGVALLRAVDPQFRSKTLDHFGIAYLVIGPVEIALVIVLPWLAVRHHLAIPGAILLAASAACFAASALLVGVFTASPTSPRADELSSEAEGLRPLGS